MPAQQYNKQQLQWLGFKKLLGYGDEAGKAEESPTQLAEPVSASMVQTYKPSFLASLPPQVQARYLEKMQAAQRARMAKEEEVASTTKVALSADGNSTPVLAPAQGSATKKHTKGELLWLGWQYLSDDPKIDYSRTHPKQALIYAGWQSMFGGRKLSTMQDGAKSDEHSEAKGDTKADTKADTTADAKSSA